MKHLLDGRQLTVEGRKREPFCVVRTNPTTRLPVTKNEYASFRTWAVRKIYPEKYKAHSEAMIRRHKELKKRVIKKYGGKCTVCGNDNPRVLQFHHTNGDGKNHRTELKENSTTLLTFLDKQPIPVVDILILCANCHAIEHTTW